MLKQQQSILFVLRIVISSPLVTYKKGCGLCMSIGNQVIAVIGEPWLIFRRVQELDPIHKSSQQAVAC
nr:hypothetical protein A6C57_12725 [Fibrella sp. ES10-3-2-2]